MIRLHLITSLLVLAIAAMSGCASDEAPAADPSDAGLTGNDGSMKSDGGGTLDPDAGEFPAQCDWAANPCLLPPGQDVQIQNDQFVCIRQETGDGACFTRCGNPHDPNECRGAAAWCIDIGVDEPLPVCAWDECARLGSCAGDATCLRFRENVGLCFLAGTAGDGETCDFSGDTDRNCQPGLVCDDWDNLCRKTCDPWGPSDACDPGSACGLYTNWTGACWPLSATGREAFESCSPEGSYCGHNNLCVQIDPPPAGANCVPVCQLQNQDSCDAHSVQGRGTRCLPSFDNAVGETDDEVGLCLPP